MATDSSTFAWRIPWTEEPGGLCSRGRKGSDTTEQVKLSVYIFPNLPSYTFQYIPYTQKRLAYL